VCGCSGWVDMREARPRSKDVFSDKLWFYERLTVHGFPGKPYAEIPVTAPAFYPQPRLVGCSHHEKATHEATGADPMVVMRTSMSGVPRTRSGGDTPDCCGRCHPIVKLTVSHRERRIPTLDEIERRRKVLVGFQASGRPGPSGASARWLTNQDFCSSFP
jgi:hypothetical protein